MSKPTQIIIAENWEYMQMVPNVSGIGSTLASDCPLPIWMTPNTDCGLTTAQIAEKDIPDGVKYEIIDADKYDEYLHVGIGSTALLLTAAITNYDFDTKVSTYDMVKVKKLAHRKRRNRRYSEFAPHDDTVSKAIPGSATDAAEVSRVGIRTTYASMQTEIDNASTVDEIYAILQKYPSRPKPPEARGSGYNTEPIS